MIRFQVKAVDPQGHDRTFMVDAPDEKSAASAIHDRGFFPFKVIEAPIPHESVPSPSLAEPEHTRPPSQPEAEHAVLTCQTCGNIVAKVLKKCPHCGAPRQPTKEEQQISNVAAVGCLTAVILIVVVGLISTTTPSSSRSYSPSPPSDHTEYKSTKPVREMDGWDRKQIDDAWDSMSQEEKRKQIYRDFGDIVDFQE